MYNISQSAFALEHRQANNLGVGIQPLANYWSGSPALPSELLNSESLSVAG
jgi:hypothetical protein